VRLLPTGYLKKKKKGKNASKSTPRSFLLLIKRGKREWDEIKYDPVDLKKGKREINNTREKKKKDS